MIPLFNQYLSTKITDIPISFGQPLDYQSLSKYIKVSWINKSNDESVRSDKKTAKCHLEFYTKEADLYAALSFAGRMHEILQHKIRLSENVVVEVEQPIIANCFELSGIRKQT